MPPRKKAAITKPKAAPKEKLFHVELGGRGPTVGAWDSPAGKKRMLDRLRWSFVDQPGAKHKAVEWINEQTAEIRKHKTDETDRARAQGALASALVDIQNAEITEIELVWDIQLDSYWDTWLRIKLYKRTLVETPGWEGSL